VRAHSAANSISDLVNVAELSVRRVIAMAKQVYTQSLQSAVFTDDLTNSTAVRELEFANCSARIAAL